jgi:hypothetical protein
MQNIKGIAEQDLPGTEGREKGEGGRVEKWPKQCMHMWINEQQQQKTVKKNFF